MNNPRITLLSITNDIPGVMSKVWQVAKDKTPLEKMENIDVDGFLSADLPTSEFVNTIWCVEGMPRAFWDQFDRSRHAAFWEQCLTGDTKISLLNGTEMAIKDLVGIKNFWVYSCLPDGTIVPGKAHSARMTKNNSELVEVKLDNKEVIRCTLGHPFMLRDGTYTEAGKLKRGDSLMPLYRRITTKEENPEHFGYELFKSNKHKDSWVPTHHMSALMVNKGRCRICKKLRPEKEHCYRHHKNFNKRDNSPTNFEWLTKEEHTKLHANSIEKTCTPEVRRKAQLGMINTIWKTNNPKYAEFRARKIATLVEYCKSEKSRRSPRRGLLALNINKRKRSDPVFREECRLKTSIGHKTDRSKLAMLWARHTYWHLKREIKSKSCIYCTESMTYNHKVTSIRKLKIKEDVYDITVEKYHNFALSSGIFVHNSVRILDLKTFATNQEYWIPDSVSKEESTLKQYKVGMIAIQETYKLLMEKGVPSEDARGVLPLHINVRGTCCINLRALKALISNRICFIAQGSYWLPIVHGMMLELAKVLPPKTLRSMANLPCYKKDYCPIASNVTTRLPPPGSPVGTKAEDPNPVCPIYLKRFTKDYEAHVYAIHPEYDQIKEKYYELIRSLGMEE